MHWLTGDEHYGDPHIISYSHRPFKDLEQMHSKFILNNNEVVDDFDTVIHLGDFAQNFSVARLILKQLKGIHLFIRGNHDKWMVASKNSSMFLMFQDIKIALTHDPGKFNKNAYLPPNMFLFHAHQHGRGVLKYNQLDCGVDNCHGKPLSIIDACNIVRQHNDLV